MNRFIELHDSHLVSLSFGEHPELVMNLYVHESDGEAGVDRGTGYYQNASLRFDRILQLTFAGDTSGDPWLGTGHSIVNGVRYGNSIPELSRVDSFELHATLTNGSELVLRAGQMTLQFFGERSKIEIFPGLQRR